MEGWAVNALAAPIFAAVPLLHRFGSLAAAPIIIFVGYGFLFVLIYLLGTNTGMQMYFLVVAALTLLFFGTERILLKRRRAPATARTSRDSI